MPLAKVTDSLVVYGLAVMIELGVEVGVVEALLDRDCQREVPFGKVVVSFTV